MHPGWKQAQTGAYSQHMIGYQQIAICCRTAKMLSQFLVLKDYLLFVDQPSKSGMEA
jgi:hypothetical protein